MKLSKSQAPMGRLLLSIALVLVLGPACGGGGEVDADGDVDLDGDGDGGLGDGGGDVDADGDVDGDADAGEDGGTDADAEVEPAPLLGRYAVVGSDVEHGSYAGEAEVREGDAGLVASHAILWDEADFEGSRIALAWEGSVAAADDPSGPHVVSVELARARFIVRYGGLSREGEDCSPLRLEAGLVRTAPDRLEGSFAPAEGEEGPTFEETWTWVGPPGETPLWRNERVLVPAHDPPPDALRESAFATFASFHALPEVAPYVDRPEFQAAVHSFVFDPTDFEFCRANPDVVRVIQAVVDPISLAEARLRSRAYGLTLAEKEAIFDEQVPERFVNSAGMLESHDLATGARLPHMSSMLWTGAWVASQAMRFLVTGEDEALDNVVRGVEGQIACHDIVGVPGQFARTVREHVDDGDPSWVQGTGAHEGYDYLPGGNNDMLHGYQAGFLWAWIALEAAGGHEDLQAAMVAVLEDLLENNSDAGDMRINQLKLDALLALMTGDVTRRLEYEAIWSVARVWIVDQGGGAMYDYGISDWSGNHLNIQTMLTLYRASRELGDGHRAEMEAGMREALDRMRHTRLGLYQLVAATAGGEDPPPPELEDALWSLREFPAPVRHYDVDRRVDPDFCMSPLPSLPWKMDWETTDRTAALVSPPLFERGIDIFVWRLSPFSYRDGENTVEEPGVDFLFAYWFGRLEGVITPSM